MMRSNRRAAMVLLVEDSPADQVATQRAFKKSRLLNDLHIVDDGEQALDFLYHRGEYAPPKNQPRPDLILLDLNLPRVDGRQVLATIKQDDELKTIPVVVLTTSAAEEDVVRSYGLGVNSFVTKPVNMQSFVDTIQTLHSYWFQIVVLPPNGQ